MSKSTPSNKLELHPDAWERFERAVGAVAKAPPQHRKKKDESEGGWFEEAPCEGLGIDFVGLEEGDQVLAQNCLPDHELNLTSQLI